MESYSVLTRLPGGLSLQPADAELALRRGFPGPHLVQGPDDLERALRQVAEAGIGGGRVYDGMIAAIAKAVGATLLTADRRAVPTYATVGAEFELIVA